MFRHHHLDQNLHLFEFEDGLSEEEADRYLQAMDSLIKEDTPFSIITMSDGESPLPQEQKKRGNLWFKANRAKISNLCRCLVRIRPDLDAGHENGNFARAMPFPVFVAPDLEQARSRIDHWLSNGEF